MKQFKKGDKVYCPELGNKVFTLDEIESSRYPLCIRLNKEISTFTKTGKLTSTDSYPCIFEATEENRELLSKLYREEFGKNESFLDKHLKLGSKVLCLKTTLDIKDLPSKIWEIDLETSTITVVVGKNKEGCYKNHNGTIVRNLNVHPISVDSKGNIEYLDLMG